VSSSGKQTNDFCFFFWGKKELIPQRFAFAPIEFLGKFQPGNEETSSKPIRRDFGEKKTLSAKQNNAFCFFFWKRKKTTTKEGITFWYDALVNCVWRILKFSATCIYAS
jgi:hypothetical protein